MRGTLFLATFIVTVGWGILALVRAAIVFVQYVRDTQPELTQTLLFYFPWVMFLLVPVLIISVLTTIIRRA